MSLNEQNNAKSSLLRRFIYVITAIIILLALLLFFLPSFFLRQSFNQEFNDPNNLLSSIRTEQVSVSPLLDKIVLTNVTLTSTVSPTLVIKISEVKASRIKTLKLLKAILGFGEDTFDLLADGELVIRNLDTTGLENIGFKVQTGTLSLEGFSLDLIPKDSTRLDNVNFKSIKFSDLKINVFNEEFFSSESLSFFNFYNSVLGGLIIGGLYFDTSNITNFQNLNLNSASVSNLDLLPFFSGIKQVRAGLIFNRPTALAQGLITVSNSIGSLDLSACSLTGPSDELIFLRRALIDNLEKDDQTSVGRLWSIEELTLDLVGLKPYLPETPVFLAVLDALGSRTTADFKASSRLAESGLLTGQFDLALRDKIGITFDLSIEQPPKELNLLTLMVSLPKLGLGQGELLISDHSFLTAFNQALSQHLFNGRSTSDFLQPYLEEYLTSLVDPKPDSRPLNKEILQIELNRFIQDPQSLKLSFSPLKGYPMSVFDPKDVDLSQIIQVTSSGDNSLNTLAEKYKYAIIAELNLTLEVNGRAPVAVYLNSSENHVQPVPPNLSN
jgi:hypothetical protein